MNRDDLAKLKKSQRDERSKTRNTAERNASVMSGRELLKKFRLSAQNNLQLNSTTNQSIFSRAAPTPDYNTNQREGSVLSGLSQRSGGTVRMSKSGLSHQAISLLKKNKRERQLSASREFALLNSTTTVDKVEDISGFNTTVQAGGGGLNKTTNDFWGSKPSKNTTFYQEDILEDIEDDMPILSSPTAAMLKNKDKDHGFNMTNP